ncbi:unnamed protein product [Prorocentrum cordatum]|uniref:peptidylprolyl isomerase n=1 Tax=Prorocentrum cordatum TaxID=2364126 RepID=A0ABN9Y8A1_9DINO|nr:unnamed protein product [Polarella glacialis]
MSASRRPPRGLAHALGASRGRAGACAGHAVGCSLALAGGWLQLQQSRCDAEEPLGATALTRVGAPPSRKPIPGEPRNVHRQCRISLSRRLAAHSENRWHQSAEVGKLLRTPGGVRWIQIRPGSGGAVAAKGRVVGVHFECYSLHGALLESTWSHHRPLGCLNFRFRLGEGHLHGIAPAVEEALEGMPVGSRRELIAPPHMLWEHAHGGQHGQFVTKVGLVSRHDEPRIFMVDLYYVGPEAPLAAAEAAEHEG